MLGFFAVFSELEDMETLRQRVAAAAGGLGVIDYVSNILQAERAVSARRDAIDGAVILVASGGTEAIINQIVFQTAKPVLLWANPDNNSLAATLEAYAALKTRFPLKVAYAPLGGDEAVSVIDGFAHIAAAIARIDEGVIGCFGAPAPWLLTSHGIHSFREFKTRIANFKLEKLLERYDLVSASQAHAVVHSLASQAAVIETTDADFLDSARLYLAMRDMIEAHQLTALTVRCYDLLDSGIAPCLGISLLNDEGIVAGCEGDLEAVFTMVLASALNSGPSWTADALRIDRSANALTLSHCTAPCTMLHDPMSLKVAMQPDVRRGAALQGSLREGPVTILRFGAGFGSLLIAPGRIVASGIEAGHVMAQVELAGSVESWLEHAPGNHQIVLHGDVRERALAFCAFKHVTPIVV
ncbi:hypothetical protein JXA88_10245 [Candidatus Fermentibacteria bacterium]|nr:hypothetical protein [Candidatus Fermentibacteria bacterium]